MYELLVNLIHACLRLASRVLSWVFDLFIWVAARIVSAFAEAYANGIRGWTKLILVTSIGGIVSVSLFVAFLLPLLSHVYGGQVMTLYSGLDERARAIGITDSENRFVGTTDRMANGDVFVSREAISVNGNLEFPDHQTLYVDVPPRHYIDCVFWHEDRYAGHWYRNPAGVDAVATAKIPYDTVRRSIALREPSIGAGGSTLPMQVTRSMRKWASDTDESVVDKIGRKLIEWRDGPILQRHRGGPYARDWQRWVSMHMPHLRMTNANEFLGVEGAALTLFGARAEDLGHARQYLLAAAVKYPIPVTSEGDSRQTRRVQRARHCARELLQTEPDLQASVMAELDALAQTRLKPLPHGDLWPLLDSARHRASTPERMGANIAGSVRTAITADLQDRFGGYFRRQVAEVRTTVDIVENAAFSERVTSALIQLESARSAGIDTARYSFFPEGPQEGIGALVVIANEDGDVIRFFNNRSESTFYGSLARRTVEDGVMISSYDPEQEQREIASTGKILAALAIAETGADGANRGYDNSCISARAEFRRRCYCEDGWCGDDRHFVRADQVFAASLNAPITRRLIQLDIAPRLHELVDINGLIVPPVHSRNGIEQNIVLGQVAARPLRVMMTPAVALDYALGGTGSDIPVPSIVSSYRLVDPDTGETQWVDRADPELVETSGIAPLASFDLNQNAEGRAYLNAVLSAPACNSEGTLHGLMDWCPGKGRTEALVVKTGTKGLPNQGAGQPDNYDWWVTGAVAFPEGERYSFLILVGSGDPNKLFASEGAGALAPIVNLALETAQADHEVQRVKRIANAG
ncbi:MAG: transglycosylase domain-containing protein [Hyphomonadaceae bacterium]|nr:transglycosylase domain-containing protein [Hyphomonadaceae bacterium]